jgi:nitronate monooxygenase
MSQHPDLARATAFCEKYNLRAPILIAPMASACPPSLAIAVANAGGLGGRGALLMQPDAIHKWVSDVRAGTNGGFQLNLWIPDPPPKRDSARQRARCTKCGHMVATLQHPGWAGTHIGFQPFPMPVEPSSQS